MQKIRKFKTVEDKINVGLKIMCAFLLVGIILIGKSYAEYKQETEVTFINAKVGSFTANDIELSMKVDNEEVSTPPSKDNYRVEVKCDNADGEWDSERWGADIRNIKSNKVKCEVNFITPEPTLSEVTATSEKTSINLSYTTEGINVRTMCKWGEVEGEYPNKVEGTNTNCTIENLTMDTLYYYQVCAKTGGGESFKSGSIKTKGKTIAENVELGDYIRMTPTSTSYTIPANLTGYTSNQTINPSELDLWRVIKKNEDGTVEAVSEYVSSKKIYFWSNTGYSNFVGANTITAQYTNEKYVQSIRHMGFSNQIEICTVFSINDCPGDTGYEIDVDLVKSTLKTLVAATPSNSLQTYWISSRYFETKDIYAAYLISTDGKIIKSLDSVEVHSNSVRPILTLKSDVQFTFGDGKSASTAYNFE